MISFKDIKNGRLSNFVSLFILIYYLSDLLFVKKRAEGEDEICDHLCKDCKAGHGKCSFFVLKSPHREHTPFQAIVLIVLTPLICVMTMALKVLYKSILHCSVHGVTASILYIVLLFGNIITI